MQFNLLASYYRHNLLLLFFFGVFCGLLSAQPALPRAQQGVLDLRHVALDKHVPLDGAWLFYWRQLLTPGALPAAAPISVSFPSLWTSLQIDGHSLPKTGFGTYALTVLLPPGNDSSLAIMLPDEYCCTRLFVNGHLLAESGRPDTSANRAVPFWINQTVDLPPLGDTLHLLLQVANFWHLKGGTYQSLLIGNRTTLYREREHIIGLDLLLTGGLFMGGLFFLGLYLFGRYDKAILFFSLFCISYSYRIVGSSFYVLHLYFPELSWFVSIHLEYLSLFLSVAFLVEYIRFLYPEDVWMVVIWLMRWFCTAFVLLALVTPPIVFTRFINSFLLVMFLYIFYVLYLFLKVLRKKRKGAVYALLSMCVLMLVFLLINLEYFSWIGSMRGVVFAGYVVFFFLQSLILSFRFADHLKQARLQAEEGSRVKLGFLSSMSHEIRTPLNSVIGLTNLLLMDKPTEEQKEHLNVLLFSANNLLGIVNDILDYNKLEAGKLVFECIPMELGVMTRKIMVGFEAQASAKGVVLKTEINSMLDDVQVMGDPTRFCQVINKLVQNAIKFTASGWVQLSMEVELLTAEDITVVVRVCDTGIGIAKDKQELIFDQFVQADSSTSRSYGGTGLGLAISKRMLELQGSSLQVESEEGHGAVFYFTQVFRLADVQPKEEEIKESVVEPMIGASEVAIVGEATLETEPPVVLESVRFVPKVLSVLPVSSKISDATALAGVEILLVEDNHLNIMVTTKILQRWGAVVEVAENGLEALEKLDVHRHKIVLLDMHMPVMDGEETAINIRGRGWRIPIFALTASLQEMELHRTHGGLIDEVISKPFQPAQLLALIQGYLAKK